MSPLVRTTICFFCLGLGIFAVNSTTRSESDEEFPGDPCLYGVVNTSFNEAVAVGCTQLCFNGSRINRPDNTSCINKTAEEVEALPTYTNFSCSVGICKNGTCVSLKNKRRVKGPL
uniref:Evasin n=1 Tax=Rhipicephalus microplus TaxID=6941 RepID=A0A6G5A4L0_RHIMP